jgi:hypothetical protein
MNENLLGVAMKDSFTVHEYLLDDITNPDFMKNFTEINGIEFV